MAKPRSTHRPSPESITWQTPGVPRLGVSNGGGLSGPVFPLFGGRVELHHARRDVVARQALFDCRHHQGFSQHGVGNLDEPARVGPGQFWVGAQYWEEPGELETFVERALFGFEVAGEPWDNLVSRQ